ncbi:Ras modification protein ERF4 [Spathaspora sp. JA1]|nr:Ras modification protein ERF4 [Spathaspora sp. JA1]
MNTSNNNKSLSPDSTAEPTELSFFNYHEFLIPQTKHSLVINHFPNNYTTNDSTTFLKTRIIRIPRCYETNELSDLIPQFSMFYPGEEPGAINQEEKQSRIQGTYDNNLFGITSTVSLPISHEKLQSTVKQVNEFCYRAFNPYGIPILLENMADLITGGLFSQVSNSIGVKSYTKRVLEELEQFIANVNCKFKSEGIEVVIISPRRSGYLSVCVI